MTRNVIPLICIGISVAGCASDVTVTSSLTPVSVLSAQPTVTPDALTLPSGGIPKKTMSDKVLTAIALERVTGLKPDPAQLTR